MPKPAAASRADGVKELKRARTARTVAPAKRPHKSQAVKTARRRIQEFETEGRASTTPTVTPRRKRTKAALPAVMEDRMDPADELLRQE